MARNTLLSMLTALGLSAGSLVSSHVVAQDTAEPDDEQIIAALRAELDTIRGALPAQAVAMTVVEYNYSNLWFAAHAKNWPLAKFLLSETRARLRWALRITPERRISTGTLALQPFLDTFEQGPYATLEQSLEAEDVAAFEAAYEKGLGACASCHSASEKPYLQLKTPEVPSSPLIDFAID
jgi:cytochrome c553